MSALLRSFYAFLLWATSFELALAKSAPERNRGHIDALQRDESEYQRELIRLEVGL